MLTFSPLGLYFTRPIENVRPLPLVPQHGVRPGLRPTGAGVLAAVMLLLVGTVLPLRAQDKPIVPPSTRAATIQIQRGSDVVQPPSLWYQEAGQAPDSLGVLRVPCCAEEPDAITYPDANLRFPVNLQFATFIRNGYIAELPISEDVLTGVTEGRIFIRPPAEDFFDIAEPFGVTPIRQVPGEETVIDARDWYEAALAAPDSGQASLDERFHSIRELRGRLRSTAPNGESVQFVIVTTRRHRPVVTLSPLAREDIVIPEPRLFAELRTRPSRNRGIEWVTSTALLFGPHRARLPRNNSDPYTAHRIKGDVTSTLRWQTGATESYEFTLFGSSQPTFGSGAGNHHDVPYGLALAARFGTEHAIELRTEARYEDDPFQRQSLRLGDQRLRLLMGYDYRTSDFHGRLGVGPTYYRDQPSSWEDERADARELGATLTGHLAHRVSLGRLASTLSASVAASQSWGYVDDAGNRNLALEGQFAFKPNIHFGSARLALGPVAYLSYEENEYSAIEGFSETNAQFGLELTTRVRF